MILPGLPTTSLEDALIERNVINSNNTPNPYPLPPPLDDPPGIVSAIPVLIGAD